MDFLSIVRLLNRWIPAQIENNPGNTILNQIRARILLSLFLSHGLLLLTCLLVLSGLHILTNKNFAIEIVLIAVISITLGLQILMFYKLENISASAIIFSMTYFGVMLGLLIATGGWHSPAKLLFFCAPVISFLVGGHQEGFYMTALVVIVSIVLMLAYKMDFQLFQLISPENFGWVEAIVWIVAINLLASCLAIYDGILLDFSKKIKWGNR